MSKGGKTTSSLSPELTAALMSNVNHANQVADRPFQPYAGPFDADGYLSANQDVGQAYQTYLQGFQTQAAAPATLATPATPAWRSLGGREGGGVAPRTATPATSAAMTPPTPMSEADFAKQHYLDTGYLEGRPGAAEARQRVADLNGDQQAAFGLARGVAGAGADFLRNGFGHGVAQSVAGYEVGQLGDTDLGRYMNPYIANVVDTTSQAIDRQNRIALNAVGSQALSQGAYGGSRQGVAQAETNRGYADTLANTTAGLYNTGYTNAQQAALQDIGLGLQGQQLKLAAANQMMNSANARNDALLDQQAYDSNRATILLTAGGQQQANQQAILDAQYQEFLRAAGYPVETLQTRQIPFSGTLPQQNHTAGAGIGGTLQGLGTIASGAAALIPLLSDRRAKTDIRRIGTADNGLGVYAYRYGTGGPVRIGFMADEVERFRPEAVVEIGGLKHVRYDLATEAV